MYLEVQEKCTENIFYDELVNSFGIEHEWFLYFHMLDRSQKWKKVKAAYSCPTLWDPMD